MSLTAIFPLLDHKLDFVDFIQGLAQGDMLMWVALAAIVAIVGFFALSQASGTPIVKGKKERRAAHRRRKHAIYEHDRD